MQRVHITTLGCRLNQFESDALERLLAGRGYTVVGAGDPADVHIINSCTITHQADRDARQLVRRLLRQSPSAQVVVTGCYATAEAKQAAALPGVDLVVDNGAKHLLVDRLAALPKKGAAPAALLQQPAAAALDTALPPALAPRRSRVYLKIQDGCDYRCAFCIVPRVRGKSRSLPIETLCAQIDALVAAHVAEIVITGVHLGTYGRDLTPRTHLVGLLQAALPRLKTTRLRLSSLDPHEVGDELIGLLQKHPDRLCRYLHLPVQSADNEVLRRMRRAHTVEDLTALVPRLVRRVAGIALGSDVIVGFPQETTEQFERTYQVLEALPLAYLHVFSYSPRRGTAAASMPGHVPAAQIAARSQRLRALSARKRQSFVQGLVGTSQRGVVHRVRLAKSGELVAMTDNFVRVRFDGPDSCMGRLVELQLVAADPQGAVGILKRCAG